MATLRAVLDASAFVAGARQVAQASQQVAQSTVVAGRGLDSLNGAFSQAADRATVTRESIKAVAGTVQTAAGFRQLTQAIRELDGSFASIVNVGAQASAVLLNFARAADDVRQLREAVAAVTTVTETAGTATEAYNYATMQWVQTSGAATAATSAQAAATSTATTATRGFAGATALLSAAWKAHPVLIVATVLAAATAAMAAFAGNTKEATEESKRLAEQQQALQRSLENIQRIQAEARVGTQFGIAGAAEEARRREQQAVFQQAVEVETQRFRGGAGVRAQDLAAGRQVEEILNAQQTIRFQREVERQTQLEIRRQAAAGLGPGGRADVIVQLPEARLREIRARITQEVAASFTIGYDEALGLLQTRFDDLGNALQQSLVVPIPEVQRQQAVAEFRQQIAPTPLLSEQERLLQAQELIDAELRRVEILGQIQSGIAEEARLAGLTTNQREQELVVLRAIQQAQQAGVALSEADLAALREAVRLTQERSAAEAQVRFNREVVEPSAEGLRLARFSPAEREAEQAVAAARAQAAQTGATLGQAEERQIRANIAAQQELNALRATGEAVGQAIGNSFVNAATGVATLRQALAGLLQDLIRIAAQRAILGPLADAFGGLFAGGPSGQGTTIQQATFDTGANAGTYASTVGR